MNLMIENNYKGYLPLNIHKRVHNLLKLVPDDHLLGIRKIVIRNKIILTNKKDTLGIYKPSYKKKQGTIELAIDTIYFEHPKLLLLIPFIGKVLLAQALYHEIGHHYQQKYIKMPVNKWEDYAKEFSTKLLKKNFYGWIIVLKPIYKISKMLK